MTELAREYGEGLFALTEEEHISQQVLSDMVALWQLFQQQPDFTRLLSNMALGKQERVSILDNVLRGSVHTYLLNFLKVLCERGVLNQYEGCLSAFKALYNQTYHIVEATVTTAVSLDDAQCERMIEKLRQMTGKQIELHEQLDPSLVGGVLLEMNGQRYDSTLKGRLSAIHSAMVQDA